MSQTLKTAVENRPLIEQILQQLANPLMALEHQNHPCGLFAGLTGELLFLYHFSTYQDCNSTIDEDVFNDKLEFLQQQLATGAHHHQLASGLCGQGWFIEYINQAQGDDYDPQLCEEIDTILLNTLNTAHWQGDIEMLSGLGGFAVYAARRQRATDAVDLYQKLIGHFEASAMQISDHTLSWSQPGNSLYRFNKAAPQTPEFNLGMAHGVPGIIAALLPALKIPALYQRAKSLLLQSCDWLMAQETTQADKVSCFSSSCNDHKGSRLGWCYGDLTIALTLCRVGKALEHPAYIDKAKQISLHAANRDSKTGMINDAGLCHGSAGMALIFQLLNQHLDQPYLLKAANYWLQYTLSLYQQEGLTGFHMYCGLSRTTREDTGLLEGYAGIGLCLLTALGADADWVDCLLMA